MSNSNSVVPLVITTLHRGVFFGYGVKSDAKDIELTDAQMCIYWSSDVQGVLGLASHGPSSSCRVSRAIPSILLKDVTSVMPATEAAVEAWKKQPWKS